MKLTNIKYANHKGVEKDPSGTSQDNGWYTVRIEGENNYGKDHPTPDKKVEGINDK